MTTTRSHQQGDLLSPRIPFDDLETRFLRWAELKASKGTPLSDGSLRVYRAYWYKFCRFVYGNSRAVTDVDASLVSAFLESVYQRGETLKPRAAATKRRYLQLLSELYATFPNGEMKTNPALEVLDAERRSGVEIKDPPAVALTESEEAMLRLALSEAPESTDWKDIRNWAIVVAVLATGLRPSEIVGLEMGHVQKVKAPTGTGYELHVGDPGDARVVPIAAWAMPAFSLWMRVRTEMRISGEAFFPATRDGKPMSAQTLYFVVSRELTAFGKKHRGASVLRATFAARQLAARKGAQVVQEWMGLKTEPALDRYRKLASRRTVPD